MPYPFTALCAFVSLVILAATDALAWDHPMAWGTSVACSLIAVMEWQIARLERAQDAIQDDLEYVNQKWFTTKD